MFVFRLHQEINDFFKWMVPTPEEHEMRIGVVQRIEKCIQVVWVVEVEVEVGMTVLLMIIFSVRVAGS